MNALVLGVVLTFITTQGSSAPQQQAAPAQQFDCTQDCDQQSKLDGNEAVQQVFADIQSGSNFSQQVNGTSQQSGALASDTASLIQDLKDAFQEALNNSQQTNHTTDQSNVEVEITSSTSIPVDGSFWWQSTTETTTTVEVTTSPTGSVDGAFWWQSTSSAQPPDSSTFSETSSSTITTSTTNLPVQTTEVSPGAIFSTTTTLDAQPLVTTSNPLTSTDNSDTFIDVISSGSGDEFITGTNEKPSIIGVSIPSKQDTTLDNQGFEEMADCTCVPYHQCRDQLETIPHLGLFNISGSDPQCEKRKLLDVCCFNPQTSSESSFSSSSLSGTSLSTSAVISSFQPRCGQRNTHGVDVHISNLQNEVQFGEFPWMIAVLRRETIGTIDVQLYQCGGSLIQPDVVLTAAHCVFGKDPNRWQIRAGEWDVRNKYEIYGYQNLDVTEVLIHPKYNPRNLHNDYAILLLEKPLTLHPHISTICLPRPEYVFPDNTTCYASGWGKTSAGKDGVYQIVQRKVELPLVHHERCQDYLRTTRLGSHFRLANEFICAGGIPGRDTCKGDGGAPLVCELPEQPGVYVQAGTVAWGIGCGEDGIPGVYAEVAKAVEWIDLVTKSPDRVGRIWEGY